MLPWLFCVCICVYILFSSLVYHWEILKKKIRTVCCEIFVEWRRSTEVSTISFRAHSFYLYNLRILFAVQSLSMKLKQLNKTLRQHFIARHRVDKCPCFEMQFTLGKRKFFPIVFNTKLKKQCRFFLCYIVIKKKRPFGLSNRMLAAEEKIFSLHLVRRNWSTKRKN